MAEREQRLAIVVTARDHASKSLKGISKELGGLDKAGRYVATRGVRGVGTAIHNVENAALGLTGVAAGAGVAAVKMAIDYESSATGIRKTVNGNVEGILKDLRKMATQVPVDVNSLNSIGEAAGALGVAKGDIVEFTRTVALLGVTTDLTTDAAATSLGHLKTTLKLTGNDFHELGDELVYLGNNGASTESEILNMAENIAGAASTVGASKEQVLGWASAMASAGEEAEAGGSSIQRFWLQSFKYVNKGGAQLKTMAKIAGQTPAAFKAAFGKDATGTLANFILHLGKLSKAEQVATLDALGFKDIRITRALLKLLGNTDNLTQSLQDAGHASGAMGKEAATRFATTASQIQLLKNNVQDAGITIGQALLPELNKLAKEGTAWLQAHPQEIEKAAHALGDGFHNAAQAAKDLPWDTIASTLKAGGEGAKTIADAFLHLPPDVQKIMVGLFAANKISGGAVSDIGGALFKGMLGGAAGGLGGLFARGGSPANPMWVQQVGGAAGVGGPGAGVGAAGAAAGASRLTNLLNNPLVRGGSLLAGAAVLSQSNGANGPAGVLGDVGGGAAVGFGVAGPLGAVAGAGIGAMKAAQEHFSAIADNEIAGISASAQSQLATGATDDQLHQSIDALNTGIHDVSGAMLGLGGSLYGGQVDALKTQRDQLQAELDRRTNDTLGAGLTRPGGRDTDKLEHASTAMVAGLLSLQKLANAAINGPEQLIAAAKSAIGAIVPKDLSKADPALLKTLLGDLQAKETAAIKSGDKATAGVLGKLEKSVRTKLASREQIARQLTKADAIVASGKSTKDKIRDLQAIERSIGDRNLTAQHRIADLIANLKLDPTIVVNVSSHYNPATGRVDTTTTTAGGGSTVTHKGPTRTASGGHLPPNTWSRINEAGQEYFKSDAGGTVLAAGRSRSLDMTGRRESVQLLLNLTVPVTVKLATRDVARAEYAYRQTVLGTRR